MIFESYGYCSGSKQSGHLPSVELSFLDSLERILDSTGVTTDEEFRAGGEKAETHAYSAHVESDLISS